MPQPLYPSVRTPIMPCRSGDDKNLRPRQEIERNFTSRQAPILVSILTVVPEFYSTNTKNN